jgi:hypothetical protein
MKLHDGYLNWSGEGSSWNVDIKPVTQPVKSFYEETVKVAEMIWSQKSSPLYLCYSGGLDSEFVLCLFLNLKMNIQPVIMRTQYNHPETKYAFKLCEEKNIKPIIIDLDYDKFIESGKFLEIATETKCAAYQYIANMWLTSQIDGTVITGDSNPHIFLKDGKWYVDEIEPTYRQFDYFIKNKIEGTPFFLSYTVEQYLSFLIDPTMKRLANNELPGKTGSYSSKVHVYNNQDIFVLEQRKKLTGYELVESSSIFNHPDMKLVESWKSKWWGSHDTEYYTLINKLNYDNTRNT